MKPIADVIVRLTTGVMPWSKSVFHCAARVEEGDWRSAGRVTMVELRFVPGSVRKVDRGRSTLWNGEVT